jgi:hypothetical protein
MSDEATPRSARGPEEAYEPPRLEALGSFERLTQIVGPSPVDQPDG